MPERWWISNYNRNEFTGGAELLGEQFCKAARLKYMSATKLGISLNSGPYEIAEKIDNRIKDVNMDVLFFNSLNCWSAKPKARTSIAVCCENFKSEMESVDDDKFKRNKAEQWDKQKMSLANSDRIVALSESERVAFGESGYETTKIEPYVDTNVFSPGSSDLRSRLGLDENKIIALYVGRPHKRKGFDIVEDLIKTKPNIFFVCIGTPTFALDNAVSITRLEESALVDCYRACDFLLMPSRYESFGYVFAEAISCGKPILSSQVGIMADDVYQKCGITTTEISAKSFSDMIDFFATTRARFDDNRKIAEERFSFERFRKDVNDLLGDGK